MKELTERQEEVLAFITGYIREHSRPPTIREIGGHFSISVKGAHDHVIALTRKGALRQAGRRKARSIELGKEGDPPPETNITLVPILGKVAAGLPIFCAENREGFLPIHKSLLKKWSDYFVLKVQGDSMEEAGIMDGDYAIIEQQRMVRNGEIAVVMLDDSVTLKRFYKEKNQVTLQPANGKYKPIKCSNYEDVRVLGRLAHLVRSYG